MNRMFGEPSGALFGVYRVFAQHDGERPVASAVGNLFPGGPDLPARIGIQAEEPIQRIGELLRQDVSAIPVHDGHEV